jgi:hypothetical protein
MAGLSQLTASFARVVRKHRARQGATLSSENLKNLRRMAGFYVDDKGQTRVDFRGFNECYRFRGKKRPD